MLHCVSHNVKNIRREKFSLCEKMWKMKILANEKKIVITRASEKREREENYVGGFSFVRNICRRQRR